jgi:hypothetical protein
MAHQLIGTETVLTGWVEDRSALFGVLAQIEGLGLELLEVRQVRGRARSRNQAISAESSEPGDYRSPHGGSG